jgi:hypothetical protein
MEFDGYQMISGYPRHSGPMRFLLDANNAAPTCYYEAASQNLGGHQRPDRVGKELQKKMLSIATEVSYGCMLNVL